MEPGPGGVSILAVPAAPFAQTTPLFGGPFPGVLGEPKCLGSSFRENTAKARWWPRPGAL